MPFIIGDLLPHMTIGFRLDILSGEQKEIWNVYFSSIWKLCLSVCHQAQQTTDIILYVHITHIIFIMYLHKFLWTTGTELHIKEKIIVVISWTISPDVDWTAWRLSDSRKNVIVQLYTTVTTAASCLYSWTPLKQTHLSSRHASQADTPLKQTRLSTAHLSAVPTVHFFNKSL